MKIDSLTTILLMATCIMLNIESFVRICIILSKVDEH